MTGLRAMPVLACADPEAVGEFLVRGLAFRLAGWWRDEQGPSFGIVALGDVTLGLSRAADAAPPPGWAAYIYVSDVRDFASVAAANGVTLVRGPEDTRYASREVDVKTPEGHLLCFAQDLAPGDRGPGAGAVSGPKGQLALQTLAMPADTNANGDIFGGWLMGQMDLGASVPARERARGRVATVQVEAMTFHRAVQVGDVVTIYADLQREGRSSMRYGVEAWITRMPSGEQAKVTEAVFIYVAIDEAGKSRPLP